MCEQNIPKTYDPAIVEGKWYGFWEKEGLFTQDVDKNKTYGLLAEVMNLSLYHSLNHFLQYLLYQKIQFCIFQHLKAYTYGHLYLFLY